MTGSAVLTEVGSGHSEGRSWILNIGESEGRRKGTGEKKKSIRPIGSGKRGPSTAIRGPVSQT